MAGAVHKVSLVFIFMFYGRVFLFLRCRRLVVPGFMPHQNIQHPHAHPSNPLGSQQSPPT